MNRFKQCLGGSSQIPIRVMLLPVRFQQLLVHLTAIQQLALPSTLLSLSLVKAAVHQRVKSLISQQMARRTIPTQLAIPCEVPVIMLKTTVLR